MKYVLHIFSVITFSAFFAVIQNNNLLSPLPDSDANSDRMKMEVLARIENRKNTYSLKKQTSLVPQSYASGDFTQAKALLSANLDTGEIYYEKNLDTPLPIASLTKIMTAIIALDLLSPENEIVIDMDAASAIPTKIGVVVGERMTVEELLTASLLTSANDATEAIRNGVENVYGDGVFVDAMNRKAQFLDLSDTSFSNPQGFDSNSHYSSVADLAVLTHYAMTNYPLIYQIVRNDYSYLPANASHKQFDLINWNGLIGIYPGAMGMKIGNTGRAQKTIIAISERQNTRILSIVLGAPDLYARDMWAADMLDIGFEKSIGLAPEKITKAQLQEKYNSWNY